MLILQRSERELEIMIDSCSTLMENLELLGERRELTEAEEDSYEAALSLRIELREELALLQFPGLSGL